MIAVVRMPDRGMAKVPPHSNEAEQAVLGMLMLAPERIDTVSAVIGESDFYRKDHRLIWRAMIELFQRGKPCDAVTLGDWLESNGLAEMAGGASYPVELANSTASPVNVLAYAQIVREKSVRRQLIDLASQLLEAGYGNEEESIALVDRGIADLMGMQKLEAQHEYTLRQAMSMAYEAAQQAKALGGKIPGVASGLIDLDNVLGGWHDSDLIIVGARPAMGKTALLLNFAVDAKLPCGIISAEQPAAQIGARVMSIESSVPAKLLRNGKYDYEHLEKLRFALERLVERTCLIYDLGSPTIADVSRLARKWKKQNDIKILFVDYVQRIEASNADKRTPKHERVGEVVRGLKNIARDLDIPVVALAQVGRHVDSREDKQPGMGDLSDSSEIEKEADQILTLYRPAEHDDQADPSLALLSVEKNRHGPTGLVKATWLPDSMRFRSRGHE